mmetsp:Transcript_28226/g.79269  ORF Transcript_28226/g.79269 Transcript_28226/m.79269 type:complete len:233 (-) Transcript_28226:419-1117(-)
MMAIVRRTHLRFFLRKIHIVVVIMIVAAAIDRSLHGNENRSLPRIELRNTIKFEACRGKSFCVKALHALDELAGKLSLASIAEGVIQRLELLKSLLGAYRITAGQMAHDSIQEVALGIELQQVALQAPATQVLVDLSCAQVVRGIQPGAAQLSDLGEALGGLRFGILHPEELRRLLVRLDCQNDMRLAILVDLLGLVDVCHFLRELGRLGDAAVVGVERHRGSVGDDGICRT